MDAKQQWTNDFRVQCAHVCVCVCVCARARMCARAWACLCVLQCVSEREIKFMYGSRCWGWGDGRGGGGRRGKRLDWTLESIFPSATTQAPIPTPLRLILSACAAKSDQHRLGFTASSRRHRWNSFGEPTPWSCWIYRCSRRTQTREMNVERSADKRHPPGGMMIRREGDAETTSSVGMVIRREREKRRHQVEW